MGCECDLKTADFAPRPYAETQKENCGGGQPSVDGGGIGQRVGDGVGECLAAEFAGELSIRAGGGGRALSAGEFAGAGDAGFDGGLESVADILSEQVESLSHAIAEQVEQSELIEGEGFFAEAVAAVDRGFEQLERSAKNRNQLAAAVDRFDAAVGGKASTAQPELNESNDKDVTKDALYYKALWHHYRQGVEANSQGELDYLVGCRAFEDGIKRRAISLMITAGSEAVQQIYQSDGKQRATKYVNYMSRRICQEQLMKAVNQRASTPKQMEL